MTSLDSPIRGLRPTLFAATTAAFVLSVVGAFTSGRFGTAARGAAIGIVVGLPLLRVVVVGGHWWRIGDRRFAALAFALLGVVAAGALLALL